MVQYYSSVFGIGPFDVYDFEPKKAWLLGKEVAPFKLKIAMADLGSVKLELIQILQGELPHRDFLDSHGEGLQHLGFYVENYDEWKSYAKTEGIDILCEAEVEDQTRGKRRGFYLKSSDIGGVLFEILETQKKI